MNTETVINGIRVVMLSPDEEKQLEWLSAERREKETEEWEARQAARQAVIKRNRIRRELKAISAKWLKLAERKYPQ